MTKTILKKIILNKTKKLKNIKKKSKFIVGGGNSKPAKLLYSTNKNINFKFHESILRPLTPLEKFEQMKMKIENTNQNSYYVSFIKNDKKYDFSPLELSVDRLQYALNTESLKINGNKISFINTMPSLLLEEGDYFTGIKGKGADTLVDVIDDYETLVDEITNLANYNKPESRYEFKIKVKDMMSETYIDRYGFENIEYVKQNAKSLEEIINNPENPNADNITCDLAGIPEYIIRDESITGYVICGYPAHFKMRPYIDLLKTNPTVMTEIYKEHEEHYMNYCRELYNVLNTSQPLLQNDSEIYKFYGYNTLLNQVLTVYNELLTYDKTIIYDDIKEKFTKYYKDFNNKLATTYLKKPMCRIRYIFLVYKKKVEDGRINLVPAFYNIKELKKSDSNILERIKKLINVEIPIIYKIPTTDTDTNLFYSYSNFGKFFCVKTEYLHTMSNINEYAFVYKNNITLEELIYAVKLGNLNTLTINYQIEQKYIISVDSISNERINQKYNVKKKLTQKFSKINKNKISLRPYRPIRPVLPDGLETSLILRPTTKVIFMFKQSGHKYIIIFRSEDIKFYIMTIESILDSIDIKDFDDIIEKDKKTVYTCRTRQIKIVTCDLNIFKITSFRLLNIDDYKNITRYNPLLIRTLIKIPTSNNINISQFYNIKGIDSITNDNIYLPLPNIFLYKPFMIRNILFTKKYIDNHTIFIEEYKNNTKYNSEYEHKEVIIYIPNPNNLNKFNNIKSNENNYNMSIKKIMFNPNNCKYNLIEIKEETKSVVWVVPFNATYTELKNEKGYENLPSKYSNVVQNKYIPNYLSNCLDLNNTHIPLLQFIIDTYDKNSNVSYLNIASILFVQTSLHVHILPDDNYKTTFTPLEQGSRLITMISTKKVLNNIKFNKNYYQEYNVDNLMYF